MIKCEGVGGVRAFIRVVGDWVAAGGLPVCPHVRVTLCCRMSQLVVCVSPRVVNIICNLEDQAFGPEIVILVEDSVILGGYPF